MMISLYSKGTQRLIDCLVYLCAWIVAYQIRFEAHLDPAVSRQMLLLSLPVAGGQVGISTLLGIYKLQWRYVTADDVPTIARAYLYFSLLLLTVRLVFGASLHTLLVPGSVIAASFVLALGGALGIRLLRRLAYERSSAKTAVKHATRYLVVGAGTHGATVVREMVSRKGIEVVGFLDDDPGKQDAIIAGVRVLGRIADLAKMVKLKNVEEVLICISPESRQSLKVPEVECSKGLMVRSRVIPTLEEVLNGSNGTSAAHPAIEAISTAIDEPPGTDRERGIVPQIVCLDPDLISSGNGKGNGNGNGSPHLPESPSILGHEWASAVVPISQPTICDKTILITGGAGFIGSSLAEKLVKDNQLILLDRSFAEAPIQYTSLLRHPNVRIVEDDILNVDLCSLVKQTQVIIHAAAILGVNRVCSSGRETLETNYVGTSRLLKALDASNAIQRFVYFSTSEVFGVNSYRVDEDSRPSVGPIAESRWSYAMSKLAGEHLVASYFRETQLPMAIVRPFNVFGPRRTGDYALRRFILNALQNEPLEIHGDGTQIRSWCYIEDFCAALLQMIVAPEAVGEDFNVGHPGNTVTIHELAHKVIQLTGSSSSIRFCSSPFPDISIRVPSLDKAKRLLGYAPKYDLNTGLKLTIRWYRDNLHQLNTLPHTSPQRVPRASSLLATGTSAL